MNKLDKIHEYMTRDEPPPELPPGMGDEVIMMLCKDMRRLIELPAEVEIAAVVDPPYRPDGKWFPKAHEVVYIHIRSRFCVRVAYNQSMAYDTLDRFLVRYKELEDRYGRLPQS